MEANDSISILYIFGFAFLGNQYHLKMIMTVISTSTFISITTKDKEQDCRIPIKVSGNFPFMRRHCHDKHKQQRKKQYDDLCRGTSDNSPFCTGSKHPSRPQSQAGTARIMFACWEIILRIFESFSSFIGRNVR